MNISLNLPDLQYILSNLNESIDSISAAADFFLERGKDQSSCQILCGEWYDQFLLFKSVQGGEKYVFLLMCVAQDVLKKKGACSELQAQALGECFKKSITKALSNINEFSKENKTQLSELLDTWMTHNLVDAEFVEQQKRSIFPQNYSNSISVQNIPPPGYLINFAKNLKELNTRQKKAQDFHETLEQLKEPSNKKGKQENFKENYKQTLDSYQKALESEQKYRQLVLKDSAEMLKDLDRQHLKCVTALKHLQSRLDELRKHKQL